MKNILLMFCVAIAFPSFADESVLLASCETPLTVDAMMTVKLYRDEYGNGELSIAVGQQQPFMDYGVYDMDNGFRYVGDNFNLTIDTNGEGTLVSEDAIHSLICR